MSCIDCEGQLTNSRHFINIGKQMNRIPNFNTLLGDLFEGIFDAIVGLVGAVIGAIGELFVSVCEAVLGSDDLVVVIPTGLVSAIVVGSGIRVVTGGGTAALVSVATLVIVAVLFVFFVMASLVAVARRKRRR